MAVFVSISSGTKRAEVFDGVVTFSEFHRAGFLETDDKATAGLDFASDFRPDDARAGVGANEFEQSQDDGRDDGGCYG